MRIALPSTSESLAYSIVAAAAWTVLAALIFAGAGDLAGALLALAVAAAIHWLVARNLTTIVTAGEVAGALGLLLALCMLADLITGHPYRAVVFLLAAGALGYAFVLLQQGTRPRELRLGGLVAVAAPNGLVHLRMLEELRDAGILTPDEFAAKRLRVEP